MDKNKNIAGPQSSPQYQPYKPYKPEDNKYGSAYTPPKPNEVKPVGFGALKDKKEPPKPYIFIVLVLLVGLAMFFFSSRGEKEFNLPEAIDDTNLELPSGEDNDTMTGAEDEDTTLENIDGINAGNSTNNTVIADETKARFNLAMADAQKAFARGDYAGAIALYNKALTIQKSDFAYAGLFTVYGAQADWTGAMIAIDQAIAVAPTNTDYWVWKLQILDEKMGTSFDEQKKVYEEGLKKTDPRTRVNLVTNFARIAESNGEISYAISLWEKAIELYSSNKAIYQKEIDRLEKI